MEKKTFQIGMAKMIAAFGVEVQPARSEVYWEALGDLPGSIFVTACKRAMAEWDKPFAFPPIAVLLRYARDASAADGAIVDGATAWSYLIHRTFPKYRPYDPNQVIDWPDPLSREIVRELWKTCGNLALLEGEFAIESARKRFVAAYDARRATQEAAPVVSDRSALGDRRDLRLVSGEE